MSFFDFFKGANDGIVPAHHFYSPAKGYFVGSSSGVASDDGNNFPASGAPPPHHHLAHVHFRGWGGEGREVAVLLLCDLCLYGTLSGVPLSACFSISSASLQHLFSILVALLVPV